MDYRALNGPMAERNLYLAAWLSPLVTLIGILIYSPRNAAGDRDWGRIVMYVATLTFLAASLTPGLDSTMTFFARMSFTFCATFGIIDRKQR
jgi:hypothetical protein